MKLLFCLLLLAITLVSIGQELKIVVTDSVSGSFLPFANLYLNNSGCGASTNINGVAYVVLNRGASKTDTLVTSYIGYKTKYTPVNFSRDAEICVGLTNSIKRLKEVVVVYKKPLRAKQIVKQAIKNTSKNYSDKDVILKCFYREIIKENNKCIQLNEAFSDVYYTSYPKKHLARDIWVDWYNNDEYVFDFDANSIFIELIHDFNTKKDKMRILASRSSENMSIIGRETALMGGPLSLTSYDKIKYQYDFLYPGIFRKYHYERDGLAYINGTTCYVINFYPLPLKRKFHVDQSRKNKHPIYVGKLYIEKESFAVVKIDYSLAVERDFGFFRHRMPLQYLIEVDYNKTNGKWNLHKIKSSELNVVGYKKDKRKIFHEGIRELFVAEVQTENVREFSDSSIFKSTRMSAVRYYYDPYKPAFWKSHDVQGKYPVDQKLIAELEEKTPLEQQFMARYEQRANLKAPVAPRSSFQFNYHNAIIEDSLHWMALPENKNQFIAYLKEENAFAKNFLIPTRKYQKKIFGKINDFFPKDTSKTKRAFKKGDLHYDFDSLDNYILYQYLDSFKREIFFNLSDFSLHKKDVRINSVRVNSKKSLALVRYGQLGCQDDFISIVPKGQLKGVDSLANIYAAEWVSDSTILYAKTDVVGRSDRLMFHVVGEPDETLILKEPDKTFDIDLVKDNGLLQCTVQSKAENEIYIVDTLNEIPVLKMLQARKNNVIFEIKVAKSNWYMLTNDEAPNNRILESKTSFPFDWIEIVPNQKHSYLQDFIITPNYIVTKSYDKSLTVIRYMNMNTGKWDKVKRKAKIFESDIWMKNKKIDEFRFSVSSLNQAPSIFKYDLKTSKSTKVYSTKLRRNNRLRYISGKREWAKSLDGVKIPITLFKSTFAIKSHKGLILKVYGAYGAITNPYFSQADVVLLNQGYVIAYAHVRGESLMGNEWYNNGKLLRKKNSFYDYIACATHLIKKKYTTPEFLVGFGNSAGGLVVGWAINEYPELFNTAILDHPYLDVVNTMMNDTLPLTTDEYKEWGNPNNKKVYNYIRSYSPYQNIKKQAYPNLIYLSGFYDTQSPAWQIAKHAAAIRTNNTGNSSIIMLTDMRSGHIGNTTGKEWIKSLVRVYSFVNLTLFK